MLNGIRLLFLFTTVLGLVIWSLIATISLKETKHEDIVIDTSNFLLENVTETLEMEITSEVYCVRLKERSLTDISEVDVVKNRSIFFLETSCTSHQMGKITIHSRQACSVESAARMHPDTDVYLLYSSPGVIEFTGTDSDDFLKALQTYKNVKILHLDLNTYLQGTIVEKLFVKNGPIDKSAYPLIHSSDILRLVTMYKYGGIYLDLDVIVLKNLWNLAPNFFGLETNVSIANGVLRFTSDGAGHKFANECLTEVRDHYNGNLWSENGPLLLERLMRKICPEANSTMSLSNLTDCEGFKIYTKERFYKINWLEKEWFFNSSKIEEWNETIAESHVTHFWNKLTFRLKAPKNATIPLIEMAKQFCPKVFAQVREYF